MAAMSEKARDASPTSTHAQHGVLTTVSKSPDVAYIKQSGRDLESVPRDGGRARETSPSRSHRRPETRVEHGSQVALAKMEHAGTLARHFTMNIDGLYRDAAYLWRILGVSFLYRFFGTRHRAAGMSLWHARDARRARAREGTFGNETVRGKRWWSGARMALERERESERLPPYVCVRNENGGKNRLWVSRPRRWTRGVRGPLKNPLVFEYG